MAAFFKAFHADARILLSQTKDAWQRQRPHMVNPEVDALDRKLRLPYGYPSGGVMNSTLTAIMLASMVPEKQFELFERSREYGDNRVVIGVHYPRDVFAGHMAATAAAQAFFETPAFMEKYEAARKELRRVLGYDDPGLCTGQVMPAGNAEAARARSSKRPAILSHQAAPRAAMRY
jgi:acid phosphatase (class A)